MQFVLLIVALMQSTASHATGGAAKTWSCTDPSTRAEIKVAIQDKFTALGLPRDLEALSYLARLADARSDQARAVGAIVEGKSGLPASALTLCEVADPSQDAPLFITVLFADPASGKRGGAVFNIGVPGAAAEFGDRLDADQP